MPVGFGFGVGDFVATIKLFKDVASALKDQGGALDDYQKTLRNLETTSAILSCLVNLNESSSDTASVNAIRSLAHLIQKDVDSFLAKIDKYKLTLGARNSRKPLFGAASKIKWSQYVAGQVGHLNQDINVKTTSLKLLLDLHISHATDAILKEQRKAQEQQHQLKRAVDQHTMLQAASDIANRDSLSHTRIDVDKALFEIKNLFNSLEASLSMRDGHITSHMATRTDVEELKILLQSQIRASSSSETDSKVSNDVSRITLVLTIPNLSISRRDMAEILRHFSPEVEAALKIFLASFLISLKHLLLALPQLIMVYRILQRLPQAISLVLHDNITFEDALGRVQSLQFQQFKNWKVFEACLRCTFELVPGAQKVSARHYTLTSPAHKGNLTPQNWAVTVRPGFVVNMSMNMTRLFAEGRWCPRGCGSGTKKITRSEYFCRACGLLFTVRKEKVLLPESQASLNAGGIDFNNHVQTSIDEAKLLMQKSETEALQTLDGLPEPSEIALDTEAEEIKAFKRIHLAEASSLSWTRRQLGNTAPRQLPIPMRQAMPNERSTSSGGRQTTVAGWDQGIGTCFPAQGELGEESQSSNQILPPQTLSLDHTLVENAPSDILVITRLTETTDEDELEAIFSDQEGYRRAVLGPWNEEEYDRICLVEFGSVSCAIGARYNLNESMLHSSRWRLRVYFARDLPRSLFFPHHFGLAFLTSSAGLLRAGKPGIMTAETASFKTNFSNRRSEGRHPLSFAIAPSVESSEARGFIPILFALQSSDELERSQQLYAEKIARLKADLRIFTRGAGHRSYLSRELLRQEAKMAGTGQELSRRLAQQRSVKENPFLKALRAKGVKSLKEMAVKTGSLSQKENATTTRAVDRK